MARNLSKSNKSKNNKSENLMCIRAMEKPIFLILSARKVFNLLRQIFIKTPILQHFDPKCRIQIETNVLGYIIGGILSQLIFN